MGIALAYDKVGQNAEALLRHMEEINPGVAGELRLVRRVEHHMGAGRGEGGVCS